MRYAALGDSFTEGIGDELPDGTHRGWTDLLAQALAMQSGEPIQYANFAVRGRKLGPIATEQVDAALALDPLPTMVTLNGGGNDMMRAGVDLRHLLDISEQALNRLLAAGVRPVLLSGADPTDRLPLGHVLRDRAELLTEGILDLAARTGVTMVDCFHDAEIRRAGYWSPDRLHLGPAGHARVASLVLDALGYDPLAIPAIDPPAPHATGPRAEAAFYRTHVTPWLARRARRRSSGDGRVGKHLDWVEVAPA